MQATKPQPTNTDPDWRPPTWRDGLSYQDHPWTPTEIDERKGVVEIAELMKRQGYLTATLMLEEKALNARPEKREEIEDVVHNNKILRDAWNTPARVWQLFAAFLPKGAGFAVDPFHNPGTSGLSQLERTLDGSSEDVNGYACDDDGFPLYWRGDITPGNAAAAANGPHSKTAQWLACCRAYGQEEFCAAFVPYRGDRWLWDIGFTAPIVFHLGRVKCAPPPGMKESSPSGTSLGLLWVPEGTDKRKLPKHTRRVLDGECFRVPYAMKGGRSDVYQWDVLVTPGSVTETVDLGILELVGRA